MGYVKDITIGSSTYPVEPMLYAVAGGTASAITASISNFDLHTGASVQIKMAADNAAGATLNVGNTGAKSIYYKGSAISEGLLKNGGAYAFVYDGTNWVVIGELLADVYSKSQAVAKADIVNNLTSTSTTAPLSANMGKQ